MNAFEVVRQGRAEWWTAVSRVFVFDAAMALAGKRSVSYQWSVSWGQESIPENDLQSPSKGVVTIPNDEDKIQGHCTRALRLVGDALQRV